MNIFSTSRVSYTNYSDISYMIDDANDVKLFLYGMAIHQAADIFAHSSYALNYNGTTTERIKHDNNINLNISNNADSTSVKESRFYAAKAVAKNALSHYFSSTSGSASDFALYSYYYDGTYYLYNLYNYALYAGANSSDLSLIRAGDLLQNVSNYTID